MNINIYSREEREQINKGTKSNYLPLGRVWDVAFWTHADEVIEGGGGTLDLSQASGWTATIAGPVSRLLAHCFQFTEVSWFPLRGKVAIGLA